MMERALLMAVLFLASNLLSEGSQLSPPDQDPFVGTWILNGSKSRPPIKATYSRTIAREGEYVLFSYFRKPTPNVRSRLKCNGQLYPTPEPGMTACEYSTPRSIAFTQKAPNGFLAYSKWELSTDGTEMRIFLFIDEKRKDFRAVRVLDRVK
jgi:hypothetical protein